MNSSSVDQSNARDAKTQLNGERWTCHEYGSPRGRYFIVSEAGTSIAQSLKCGPERARLIAAAPDLLDALHQLSRCLLPVHMGMAEAEMLDEPYADSAVVLRFMGSGASDQVTAGEVRAALGAAQAALKAATAGPAAGSVSHREEPK